MKGTLLLFYVARIHWFQRGFLGGAHHVGPKAPAHQQVARCIRILPKGEEESALQS